MSVDQETLTVNPGRFRTIAPRLRPWIPDQVQNDGWEVRRTGYATSRSLPFVVSISSPFMVSLSNHERVTNSGRPFNRACAELAQVLWANAGKTK